MADQVTDNRTDIADGTTVSGWEDIGGTALAVDTEIRYDTFSGSIGGYVTTTRDATMFNNSGIGLFASGDHAYLLFNCGVVSLLDTKALAGLTVRVAGAVPATDWAEFELFGSDEWPVTFDGGWAQIVIDIDELLANPTNTGSTAPTVANIQYFGITFITASVMPRMTDNIWVGGFRILGANTPGLIVEGRDGGSADWNLASIAAVPAVQLSATLKPGPAGSFINRTPIQFGVAAGSITHTFLDINPLLLWDFQEVMLDGFYKLSALGNSGGTTNVTFGVKTGSGPTASGSQGGAIQASLVGARWDMDFNDPDIDGINFYGSTLLHGGDFLLDDVAVSVISSLYIDCTSALVNNSEQLKISGIDPDTLTNVAFMTTDNLGEIASSIFEFSVGHAIEITVAGTYSFSANFFVGAFGGTPGTNLTPSSGSADAMILNSSGGLVTINIAAGGDSPSIRNTAVSTTQVNNDVTLTFTGMKDLTEVRVYAAGTQTELAGIEDATAGSPDARTFPASIAASTSVDIMLHSIDYITIRLESFVWPTTDTALPISQQIDRNYENL